MKRIFGYIFRLILPLLIMLPISGQDTLRTYGPRLGIDLVRIAYIFADPAEMGAEASVDLELFNNVFPVLEAGYNSISEEGDLFNYRSEGTYARIGIDYNLLPVPNRSVHHSIHIGFRYGISAFNHRAEQITVPSDYWGDFQIDSYENSLLGHWLELVGGVKAEVAPNFFLGWSVRYRALVNPMMDESVTPRLVPGYGNGTSDRGFGFTYSIYYKIPLLKKDNSSQP